MFALIGGFSSLVNLIARVVINYWTSYEVAITLAFPIALITAFLLNRALIFRSIGSAWKGQFFRFLLVNLATLIQIFVISVLLARLVFPTIGMRFHAETVAHGIALITPVFTAYWLHRRFTFANQTQVAGTAERRR